MKPMRWQVLLLLLVVLAGAGSCGKKGDPSIPIKGFSEEIRDLSGAWDGGFIVLWGDFARVSGGKDMERIKGCRVYYGAYNPAEPPCEGCPVRYEGYHEFGVESITGEGLNCKIPGKRKDALHYFKVHLIGPEGALGPASERVRVDPLES